MMPSTASRRSAVLSIRRAPGGCPGCGRHACLSSRACQTGLFIKDREMALFVAGCGQRPTLSRRTGTVQGVRTCLNRAHALSMCTQLTPRLPGQLCNGNVHGTARARRRTMGTCTRWSARSSMCTSRRRCWCTTRWTASSSCARAAACWPRPRKRSTCSSACATTRRAPGALTASCLPSPPLRPACAPRSAGLLGMHVEAH